VLRASEAQFVLWRFLFHPAPSTPCDIIKPVKLNIQLGAGATACAVCLFISYVAFQGGNVGLGCLFLLVGFAIAVLGFVLGGKDGSKLE
jgi:hypothetical protein